MIAATRAVCDSDGVGLRDDGLFLSGAALDIEEVVVQRNTNYVHGFFAARGGDDTTGARERVPPEGVYAVPIARGVDGAVRDHNSVVGENPVPATRCGDVAACDRDVAIGVIPPGIEGGGTASGGGQPAAASDREVASVGSDHIIRAAAVEDIVAGE